MSSMRSFLVCWLIFVVSIYHARGQDPLPIMELYAPDVNSVTKISECKDGLINDVDVLTVRGKVNKNGSRADAYKDNNLYFQQVADFSTYFFKSECQPDLSVCGSNLTRDCYCESKDANGDYHLVMTIMAKSIYSGGKLLLSWNDARSPRNPLIVSNRVDYYPGTIREPKKVTLKIGSFEKTIDTDPSSETYTYFRLNCTADMTSATFCVYNLEAKSLIEIKSNENTPVQTTRASCVTLDFTDQGAKQVLTMSFTETGGCERTGSYILRISLDCGLQDYHITLFFIISLWMEVVVAISVQIHYRKYINKLVGLSQCDLKSKKQFQMDSQENSHQKLFMPTLCFLVFNVPIIIILLLMKQISKPECGLEDYEIALIMITSILTLIGVILVPMFYLISNTKPVRRPEDQWKSHKKYLRKVLMVIVCSLLLFAVLIVIAFIWVKPTRKPDCGVEDYEIALTMIMCILIAVVVIFFLVPYYKCNKNRYKISLEYQQYESEIRELEERMRQKKSQLEECESELRNLEERKSQIKRKYKESVERERQIRL